MLNFIFYFLGVIQISEKFLIPEGVSHDDDGLNTSSVLNLTEQLGSKSLQVTDEQGNPLRFTTQDGCEVQVGIKNYFQPCIFTACLLLCENVLYCIL